jgi:hypothetical protein
LRLRVWNDVRRRREAAIAAAAGLGHSQEQEQENEQEVDDMREQRTQQQSVAIQIEPIARNNNISGVETDTPSSTTIPRPPRVADVYAALRIPTPPNYVTSDNTSNTTPTPTSPIPIAMTTTPSRSGMRTPASQQQQQQTSNQLTSDSTLFDTRQSWIERLRDLSSRLLFTETRVWMIEISRRDGVMDEYALTVPSPVYCGYRLPGYEDVLLSRQLQQQEQTVGGGGGGGGEGGDQMAIAIGVPSSPSTTTVNDVFQQQQQQSRYGGPPPAYFSDSEDDEEDDDEDEEEVVPSNTTTTAAAVVGIHGGNGSGNSGSTVSSAGGRVTMSGTHQHQRPMEMTTVSLSTGPSTTPVAVRIGGHLGRIGNHLHQQQGSTMSGSTMTTSSNCSAATSRTTLALTLGDKDKDIDELVEDLDTPSTDKEGSK